MSSPTVVSAEEAFGQTPKIKTVRDWNLGPMIYLPLFGMVIGASLLIGGLIGMKYPVYGPTTNQGQQQGLAGRIADIMPNLPTSTPGPNAVQTETAPTPAATPASDGGAEMSYCTLQRTEPRDVCLLGIVTAHPGTKAAELSANLIREQLLRNARPTPRRANRARRR